MAENPKSSSPPTEVPAPAGSVSPPGPTSPSGPASPPGPVSRLQPPHHWAEMPLEDDTDSALGEEVSLSTASISSSILKYRTVNGRTYHSDRSQSQYWGANDEMQNKSLDIGHYVYTIALGDKLYLAPLPEKVNKVVDIGTGPGQWAIDFADEHPEAEVIGTDISPIQPTWVPPNVSFQIEDFNEPWTIAENSVDFVHARWLVGSVRDWVALFRNAYRVLKPGGWIESYDFDGFFKSDDNTLSDKTAISQWGHIFQEGANKLNLGVTFSPVAEQLQRAAAEAAGFQHINEKKVKIPISEWSHEERVHDTGLYMHAAMLNDVEGTMGFMASEIGWTKEDITVYAAHLRKEMRNLNIHAYHDGLDLWAQKPLDA